jgi:hypothetical protein
VWQIKLEQIKFFKKLSCNNYVNINEQIFDYIKSTGLIETSSEFWNFLDTLEFVKATPLLQEWLALHQLKIRSLAVTIGRNPSCCSVHVDTPPAVNKLSWPVSNTKHTFNRWFQELVPNCDVKINQLGGKSYLNTAQLEEIARSEVDEPSIINAGIPHDVWCDDQAVFPRIGLQCMLFREPTL